MDYGLWIIPFLCDKDVIFSQLSHIKPNSCLVQAPITATICCNSLFVLRLWWILARFVKICKKSCIEIASASSSSRSRNSKRRDRRMFAHDDRTKSGHYFSQNKRTCRSSKHHIPSNAIREG